MTGVQTCALPICFPVTIAGGRLTTGLNRKRRKWNSRLASYKRFPLGEQKTVGDKEMMNSDLYGMHDRSKERRDTNKKRSGMVESITGENVNTPNGNKLAGIARSKPVMREGKF